MADTITAKPVAGSTGWQRVRALLALLSIELAVLVATGVALYFVYRPTAPQAWGDLLARQNGGELPPDLLWSNRLRLAHRLAGYAAIPTGLAAAIALAVGDRPPFTAPRGVVHAVPLGIIAPVATYTGFLLPWDQLALWSVSVETDVNGFGILFRDEVRFVIIRGVEVDSGTILWWLVVHAALGAALLITVFRSACQILRSGAR